jgi:hypothetical protein
MVEDDFFTESTVDYWQSLTQDVPSRFFAAPPYRFGYPIRLPCGRVLVLPFCRSANCRTEAMPLHPSSPIKRHMSWSPRLPITWRRKRKSSGPRFSSACRRSASSLLRWSIVETQPDVP